MKKNEDISWDREVMEKCPILYCMRDASMMETCMCWGFECGEGWKEPLWSLSAKLEALNMQYWPKYHIRIQAAQVKEKFGTLRFYYDIVKDGAWYKRIPHNFFYKLNRKLKNVNYACKEIQDELPYVEHCVEELETKEAYVKEKHRAEYISNVTVEEKDGKWFKYTDILHYGKYHYEPTKHKFLYKLIDLTWKLVVMFDSYGDTLSKKQQVIEKIMQTEADKLIRDAEDACHDTCEDCGTNIGKNGWDKRCETAGWIKYVCEDCAKKIGGGYYMDDAYFEDGKCIETKEERKKKRDEKRAKYEATKQKFKEEDDAFEKELQAAREEDIKAGRVKD